MGRRDKGQVIVEYVVTVFVIAISLFFILQIFGIIDKPEQPADEFSWHELKYENKGEADNLKEALNDAYQDTCLIVGLPVP